MTTTQLPRLTSTYPLADEAVTAFRRDGHVLLRSVADAAEVAPYREAVTGAVHRLSTETRSLDERDTYGRAFLQVTNLWQQDETCAGFVLASRFAGIAAALLGTEHVRLYHDQALYKEPGGGPTPWHQDAMYWPLDGQRCLTMWMPLVDVTPERGGLAFASGSHLAGPLSDIGISDASQEHFDHLLPQSPYAVTEPVAMAAGDATFHAGWTVHKALPNGGDRAREVMTVIWFADGLRVQPPRNPAQANDLAEWLPGLAPGDLAASPLNPRLPQAGARG